MKRHTRFQPEESPTDKYLTRFAWIVIIFSILYFGGHVIYATTKAYGWDGLMNPGYLGESSSSILQPESDAVIELNSGTRELVQDSGLVLPGMDVTITDSENTAIEMEVITVMPTPAGVDQIEVYDPQTNTYYELEMQNR